MLWRALRHVGRGTYIDVGANDPSAGSVTRAFYDRGWRGINIEPVPFWHERLCAARPEDTNLRVAVADRQGDLLLYEIAQSGLSTLDQTVAEGHRRQGKVVSAHLVPGFTLTHLCERQELTAPHFLKIDVEGAEAQVLAGADFGRIRPWVILVEATRPESQEPAHEEWEPLLAKGRYSLAYFDGLNRFYVAAEHAEVLAAFATPPNVFDDYVTVGQYDAEMRLAQIYGSLSWRLTRPLRAWDRLRHLLSGSKPR